MNPPFLPDREFFTMREAARAGRAASGRRGSRFFVGLRRNGLRPGDGCTVTTGELAPLILGAAGDERGEHGLRAGGRRRRELRSIHVRMSRRSLFLTVPQDRRTRVEDESR